MLLRLENSYNSMAANMRHLERIANNLANVNTVGYRQDRIFTEVLKEEIDAESAPHSTRRMHQYADHRTGSMESTGNPLDVAINGEGFFVVNNPETGESHYTRAGRFVLNEDGVLQTPNGLVVDGSSGQIDFPPEGGDIEIRRNGDILFFDQLLGSLRVVQFDDPSQLKRIDDASFLAGDQIPQDIEEPAIIQGQVEMSNVNALVAMTELIENSRLFESQQKAMRTIDLYLQRATRELARF